MAELASALPWGQNETAFVADLQAGSEEAFDWLVTHYQAPVFNLAYGILGDAADAADVTQEVFLKAFRGIRRFGHRSSLKTWLYRIAVREALNHRRWCWRHLRGQMSLESREPDSPPIEVADDGVGPFDRLVSREAQELVRRALAAVPAVFRGAVVLRDIEGMSYEDIAEVLDVSVGTVKSRILRGRRALRQAVGELLSGNGRAASPVASLRYCADLGSEGSGGGS